MLCTGQDSQTIPLISNLQSAMFLKNSRTRLVLKLFFKSKHYAEAYVLICRVPLERLLFKP